jgi:hypothetical protein
VWALFLYLLTCGPPHISFFFDLLLGVYAHALLLWRRQAG